MCMLFIKFLEYTDRNCQCVCFLFNFYTKLIVTLYVNAVNLIFRVH